MIVKKQILTIISKIKTEKELSDFLIGILTLEELEQIDQRIKIIKMLKKGISQQKIAEKLGVGIATVTRGSKMIKEGHFKNAWWA